ncbi:3-deoxy-D-manno-octulosonic acid transferase [Chthonomonas calidirosea]|uniref:3-deoxy-D-manno-octulosonic acid transferase n=1 Tax=Chthonomonas calidirosea TaxID=454171 RepID=UPI0006EC7AF1|nr:3-deoxy-D-manno-octulosonic acid transferase [Chthonomonas calidirosea]CEK18335.1 3-deoxy-D-manno-octulosonic-acid transferase [Chthonomonas calidirosea]
MNNENAAYYRYNLLLAATSPLLALFLAQRFLSGKSRPGWSERWGHLPSFDSLSPNRIWVHAVSAGEVVASLPILRALKSSFPDHALFLSVITPAGHEVAVKQAAAWLEGLFYAPFDLPWVVKRVVRTLRPQLYVSLESELWPNLLHMLKRHGVNTALVNGRITPRSFERARRFAPGLFRWMLGNVDLLLMQSQADAERVAVLGGAPVEGRIHVVGNTKFDQELHPLDRARREQMKAELRLPLEAPVLVAGSTRSANEERIVVQAFLQMRRRLPSLCLIVAPRQLSRVEETLQILRQANLNPARRTSPQASVTDCLVLDTMGELADVYAVADVAFLGNTFPPVVQGGGQNILQPLAHGKPVLHGPHYATIRAEVALAQEAGVAFPVANAEELAAKALQLLGDKCLLEKLAHRAQSLIQANRGASQRCIEALAPLLKAGALR